MLPFLERLAKGMVIVREDPLFELEGGSGQVAVYAELDLAVLVQVQVAVLEVFDAHEGQHVGEHLKLLLFEHCVLLLQSLDLL